MGSFRIVTNRELWQALREELPELPETTTKAVLRADLHQASLEWQETQQGPDGTYSLRQRHRWNTKSEADRLWITLFEKLGRLPGVLELRIEMRDWQGTVEVEARFLWLREMEAEAVSSG